MPYLDLLFKKYHAQYGVVSGYNFADDRIQTINAALIKNNPTMDVQEWSMMSYLGRFNYDLKDVICWDLVYVGMVLHVLE